MLAMLFTLLFVLSTAQVFQFAHDVRDPIFAQLVVDSDGGALLEDPRFAHVTMTLATQIFEVKSNAHAVG